MNIIKKERLELGYTQAELVEKSGLSLRTVQRIEADTAPPKGHSLKMLAQVFNLAPAELRHKFAPGTQTGNSDQAAMKLINLSVLAFLLFPFGNIFLPFFVWQKNRSSKAVDEVGRSILNFQVFWTVLLIFFLSLSPFIDISAVSATPLILYVLLVCLVVNVAVVFLTARSIQRGEMNFPRLPLSLF